MTIDKQMDRFCGCLLGLATGDAVGTTLEFRSRGSFSSISDMVGGGPFNLAVGEWTDDTSMALCLATSLIEKNGFDATDQMDRYCNWYEHGYLSSTGKCFDIGSTTRAALQRYRQTKNPFSGSADANAAGNGSIMRLAPVPLFYFPDTQQAVQHAIESSKTTHAAQECLDACYLLAEVLCRALGGQDKNAVLLNTNASNLVSPSLKTIATGSYLTKTEADIRGSGYVVQSLEAALWCFATTDTFEQAVLKAANLGDDADTTAAICGQVAGAFYGESGIPARWVQRLKMGDEIRGLAVGLMRD